MRPIAWYAIVPLMLAALIVGVIESLDTSWGLVRYWWVIAKLALTVIATAVLLLQMRLIDGVAAFAAGATVLPPELGEARAALVLHSAGGLAVLLLAVMLSIYKPRGRTRHGQRRATALGRRQPLLQPVDVVVPGDDVGIVDQLAEEGDRRLDPVDDEFVEGARQPPQALVAGAGVDDQLADQAVVVGRDRIALIDA